LPLPPAQSSSPTERVVAQSGRASPAGELRDAPSLGGAASAGDELGMRSSLANVPARSESVSPLAAAAQTPLALAARTEPRDARSSAGSASAQRPALPSVEAVLDPYHIVAASLGLPPLTLEL